VRDRFLAALRARIAETYGQGGGSPHLARIINDRHAERLSRLTGDALSKGARMILDGGTEGRDQGPSLIEAITPEMDIDREEIFGPILPILTYDDLDEVIGRINAHPKPLALYVFDRDRARTDRIVAGTSSGAVGVNLTMLHYSHAGLPFGGVNASGIGAAHGEYGFREFSHLRPILTNRFSLIPLVFPPYEGRTSKIIGLIRRVLG
jgi:aldehyde dehydrogenase (NAD+)